MLRINMLRRTRVRRNMRNRYAFRRCMLSRGINLDFKKEYIVVGVGIFLSIIVYKNIITANAYSKDYSITYVGENIDYDPESGYKIKVSKARAVESIAEDTSKDKEVAESRFADSDYIWPVPDKKNVSSGFGQRKIFGGYQNHIGIDISGKQKSGFDIVAVDDGEVTFSGTRGTYGKLVIIKHPDGNETRYAHNSSILVSKGDKVKKGDVVAKMGNTGRSTGPHLHFEIRVDGIPIDPLQLLPDYKEVPTKVLYKAKVKDTVEDLNIRSTISYTSGYNILTTIPGGTTVEVLREDKHPRALDKSISALVRTPDGTIGYCKVNYLEKN